MSHEHQVVELCAAPDARFPDGSAVHAGVCLHLHVVFEHCWPGLGHLVPGSVLAFGEAEAITADDGPVLQNDAIADAAVFAHNGVGVGDEVIANLRTTVDGYETVKDGIAADLGFLVDVTVRSNMRTFANPGRLRDDSGRVSARRVLRRLVKKFNGLGKCQIGIC